MDEQGQGRADEAAGREAVSLILSKWPNHGVTTRSVGTPFFVLIPKNGARSPHPWRAGAPQRVGDQATPRCRPTAPRSPTRPHAPMSPHRRTGRPTIARPALWPANPSAPPRAIAAPRGSGIDRAEQWRPSRRKRSSQRGWVSTTLSTRAARGHFIREASRDAPNKLLLASKLAGERRPSSESPSAASLETTHLRDNHASSRWSG